MSIDIKDIVEAIAFLILLSGFIVTQIRNIKINERHKVEIYKTVEKEIELINMKITYQSEVLHTYIAQNEKDHADFKSIYNKLDEIFQVLAVLQDDKNRREREGV